MLGSAGALARSTHPGPSLAVTAVAILLGVAVGLEWWRILVLGAAILLDQISVGLSNDALDAHRDREAGRADKPVARGDVGVRTVYRIAVIAALLSLVATLPLGVLALAAHAIALGSAWLYNVVAKSTPVSVLPYVVSFGLLPAIASLAAPHPAWPQWWALAAGALLGIAAHVANVLPDLDDDRRTGVRGLPHRLGPRPSLVIAWAALVLAALAVASGSGFSVVALVGLGASVVLAVAGVSVAWRRGAGRWLFLLVIVAALVDVTLLVLAGHRIVTG
ncbi:UbiA family prenyltransferase [Pseudolysinimonas sp.]|uniref:UbiA family prenyltransferase n=1 Tax=Pseudolysinimonas sp. TaxID=2680009 RepID=UPI003F80FDEE